MLRLIMCWLGYHEAKLFHGVAYPNIPIDEGSYIVFCQYCGKSFLKGRL